MTGLSKIFHRSLSLMHTHHEAEMKTSGRKRRSSIENQPVHQATASKTAFGGFAATRRSTRAAPVGLRRPCSQLRRVAGLMPSADENAFWLIPTSHEIWTFVGRPLAAAPSACKQAAYDGKSKNQAALV
jgi:hypothetical protein